MKILRSRIYEKKQREADEKMAAAAPSCRLAPVTAPSASAPTTIPRAG